MRHTLLAALVLAVFFVLVGCGGGGGETPEQAVTNALNAINNFDIATAKKYFDPNELGSSDSSLMDDAEGAKLILKNLTFKVLSSSVDGDTATVRTEITNTDHGKILAEYFEQLFAMSFAKAFSSSGGNGTVDEETAEQMFYDLLKREDNETLTSMVDIKLTKNGNSWRIVLDEPLEDAILGGLLSYKKESDEASVEDKLREVRNYVVGELWNEGFVDISSYVKTGKSSIGTTLDIDFTIQQLDYAMEKKPEYDEFISGLEGEKYERVKQVWEKLSAEIDKLYNKVKTEKPTANNSNYDFDLSLLDQYMDAFTEIVDELNE